ncbi:MAG: YHS domain-containing (seleno)protein [Hyphomicrobiaceae bacterium]
MSLGLKIGLRSRRDTTVLPAADRGKRVSPQPLNKRRRRTDNEKPQGSDRCSYGYHRICDRPQRVRSERVQHIKGNDHRRHGVGFRANDLLAISSGLGVVPGQVKYTHVHDGVAYYFAPNAAKKKFAAAPDKHIPNCGGYCAFGVAVGKKLGGSPRFADIVDGKLYLFLSAAVLKKHEQDKAGVLAKVAANWPAMHHVSVSEVNGGRS